MNMKKWMYLIIILGNMIMGQQNVCNAYFTVNTCNIAQAGYPIWNIDTQDPDEVNLYPTQTIEVNVIQTGPYEIKTKSNGITFSASGNFTQTGIQNVILKSSGIPENFGEYTFLLESCSFNRKTYIPDKRYKDITDQGNPMVKGRHHRMLYYSFKSGNSSRVWLNQNLGAEYTKVGSPKFNPDAIPTDILDYNANGNLFQWGRFSDGHELVNWTAPNILQFVNGTVPVQSPATPSHNQFITESVTGGVGNACFDWRITRDDDLWKTEAATNNPCPSGFKVPTKENFEREIILHQLNNFQTVFNSPLHFTRLLHRTQSGTMTPDGGGLWLSYYFHLALIDTTDTWGNGKCSQMFGGIHSNDGLPTFYSNSRATGAPLRCIKN